MLFPLHHARKAQPSTNLKISSHLLINLQINIWTMCYLLNNAGIYFKLCGGKVFHLLLASYQELNQNSFLNSLLFWSHTPGMMPVHFWIKNTTIFSFFILLAILQSWHLISASNYLVSSILLLIFFKGVETCKIALWSVPKRSQLSQNMKQIIPTGISLKNKVYRSDSKFPNSEMKACKILLLFRDLS